MPNPNIVVSEVSPQVTADPDEFSRQLKISPSSPPEDVRAVQLVPVISKPTLPALDRASTPPAWTPKPPRSYPLQPYPHPRPRVSSLHSCIIAPPSSAASHPKPTNGGDPFSGPEPSSYSSHISTSRALSPLSNLARNPDFHLSTIPSLRRLRPQVLSPRRRPPPCPRLPCSRLPRRPPPRPAPFINKHHPKSDFSTSSGRIRKHTYKQTTTSPQNKDVFEELRKIWVSVGTECAAVRPPS